MPQVPAFCDTCEAIFPSGIFLENVSNITLVGNSAGPCPRCGGMGHIPDGIYNFIGQTIDLLSGPRRSVAQLQKLSDVLQNAQRQQASSEEIRATLKKELPELSSLSSALPENRNELYQFITIIISIISLMLTLWKDSKEPPKIEINEIINAITKQPQSHSTRRPQTKINGSSPKEKAKKRKIGRNELCYCGSGKKYKYCHLPKE
jgi:hypothetical protein